MRPSLFPVWITDALRLSLENRANLYLHLLVAFTLILLAGALLEEVDVLIRFKYRVDTWLGTGKGKLTLLKWEPKIKHLGFWMVVFGIAGEGVFEVLVSRADDSLRNLSNSIITGTQQESARANERAGKSQDDAAAIARDNLKLGRDLEAERQKTARDKRGTIEAERALVAQQRRLADDLADTTTLLDKTKSELVDLAVCNAPRVIGWWIRADKTSSVDPLKPFAGQSVVIEAASDGEAKRASAEIATALRRAGWDVKSPIHLVDRIADGVELQVYNPWRLTWTPSPAEIAEMNRAQAGVDAIIDFLHSANWQVTTSVPRDDKGAYIHDPSFIPPGLIKVRVGLYPATQYVRPPILAQATAATDKVITERRKAVAEERDEYTERFKKTLPPDRLQAFEKQEKENAKIFSRIENPCKAIDAP